MANNPISQSNQVEFNDSVLTTKAWNSSRYDGRQLSASKINQFTIGDSTYGKTPVIQNYSRNIYVGNAVVSPLDDTGLVNFKDFSYATTNKFITVNDDDSIVINDIDSTNDASKIGFYQSFYDDFPLGGRCRLVFNDILIKNNTLKDYAIFANFGALRKFATVGNARRFRGQEFTTATPPNINVSPGSYLHVPALFISPGFESGSNDQKVTINDEEFIQRYFSGSFNLPNIGVHLLELSDSLSVFSHVINNRDKVRTFCTFLTPGGTPIGPHAIRTNTSSSISGSSGGNQSIITNRLSELSTAEFEPYSGGGVKYKESSLNLPFVGQSHYYKFKDTSPLKQNYLSLKVSGSVALQTDGSQTTQPPFPSSFISGGIAFSYADDDTPSLLLNLKKERELPNDIGDKPFIIVPENLHPYIKDNLSYFLTQAGIDVGGNTSTILKINPRNRLLK